MAGNIHRPFVHNSLNSGEIRLLVIHPSAVTWSLQHVSLYGDVGNLNSIEFDALSYTGGDQTHDFPLILADGAEPRVHENLNTAFPCIARRPGELPILIDAVSNNQSLETEKRSQIAIMHEIYRRAKACIGMARASHQTYRTSHIHSARYCTRWK